MGRVKSYWEDQKEKEFDRRVDEKIAEVWRDDAGYYGWSKDDHEKVEAYAVELVSEEMAAEQEEYEIERGDALCHARMEGDL